MPAWLLAALALLAPTIARGGTTALRALGGGPGTARLAAGVGLGALATGGLGIPGVDLFPDGKPRRRRRRRALTASDRADIGFITGILGTAAGRAFALTIASRTT